MLNAGFVRKGLIGALILGGGLLLLSSAARMTGNFLQNSSPLIYIYNCLELQTISVNPGISSNYALANDIDCSSIPSFTPISTFSGLFDGHERTIANVNIDVTDEPAGIFAVVNNASIKNLNIKNIVVKNTTTTAAGINPQHDVGALAGRAEGDLDIQNITAENIHIEYQTFTYDYGAVGGLIGRVNGSEGTTGKISSILLNQGTVKGLSGVGGLIGRAVFVDISNTATILNVESSSHTVGGLIGEATSTHVSDSYAGAELSRNYQSLMGKVTSEGDNTGGLIGYLSDSTVTRTYAIGKITGKNHVGGLIGFNANCSSSIVKDSYWGVDSTTIQPSRQVEALDESNNCVLQEDVFNGVGLDNEKLGYQSTFENWDFAQRWSHYPYPTFPPAPITASSANSENVTEIKDCEALYNIESDSTGNYILANDIDCSEIHNFLPIKNFEGTFDGNHKTIFNVTIANLDGPSGIFATIHDGKVVNINLNNVYVSNTSTSRTEGLDHDTGALAGSVLGRSEVGYISATNITVIYTAPGPNTGATGGLIGRIRPGPVSPKVHNLHIMDGKISGTTQVGGLLGNVQGDVSVGVTITQVSSLVDVTSNGHFLGGLVGHASFMDLQDSYATAKIVLTNNEYVTEMGNVIGQPGSGYGVGGLVGNLRASKVERTYSMGKVGGVSDVGAMIGINVGCNISPVTDSYWNEDSTGIKTYREVLAYNAARTCVLTEDIFNGFPIKDSRLRDQDLYENWDFLNTWKIYSYPIHKSMVKYLASGAR